MAGEGSKLTVGHGLTVGNGSERFGDLALEWRTPGEVELYVLERGGLPGKVACETLGQRVRTHGIEALSRQHMPEQQPVVEQQLTCSEGASLVQNPDPRHETNLQSPA